MAAGLRATKRFLPEMVQEALRDCVRKAEDVRSAAEARYGGGHGKERRKERRRKRGSDVLFFLFIFRPIKTFCTTLNCVVHLVHKTTAEFSRSKKRQQKTKGDARRKEKKEGMCLFFIFFEVHPSSHDRQKKGN